MTPVLAIREAPPSPGNVSSRWFGASATERLLKAFTVIEPGEGIGALLLAGNVFLLLTAYYMLKTVREALILAEAGAEVKAYAAAGQAALLLAVIPGYGWWQSGSLAFAWWPR